MQYLKLTSLETEEVSIAYPIMSSLGHGADMLGLHNIDLISERHIQEIAEDVVWLKQRFPDRGVAASIMGHSREDWHMLVAIAEQAGADLIEVSISCPQGAALEGEKAEGWMISQDSRLTEKVTRWVCEAAQKVPAYIKLSSNVTDLAAIARAVERGGGRGICVIDSPEGIVAVDLDTFSPLPSVQGYGSRGGFTGKAIKPIALRCVADVAQAVRIPVSGVGGIYDWRDAVQFILLGAATLQVCTAVMHRGFTIIDDLCNGIQIWMEAHDFLTPADFTGLALPRLTEHDRLPHGISVISQIEQALCIGCGLCYVACMDGGHQAIAFPPDRRPGVISEKCVGCGLCAQVCPVPDCITMCI